MRFCERGFCGKRESNRFAALNGNFQFTLTLYDKLWFWPRHNGNGHHIKSTTKTIDVSFIAALMPRLSDALVAPFLRFLRSLSAFSAFLPYPNFPIFPLPPFPCCLSPFSTHPSRILAEPSTPISKNAVSNFWLRLFFVWFFLYFFFFFAAAFCFCFVRPSSAASST